MTYIELDKQPLQPKGKFVIYMEDDGTIYSTDSYFWWSYFRFDDYQKQFRLKKIDSTIRKRKAATTDDYIKAIADEYKSQLLHHPDKADTLKKEFKAELERLYD